MSRISDVRKIMIIFGTRPEAIKLAPVIKVFNEKNTFKPLVVVTAQHKEMLYQVIRLFDIKPDYDLGVMKPKQNLFELTSRLLTKLKDVLEKEKPDLIMVQGDTTTTFIGALASFYMKIPIAHIEAGLRSTNKYHPFPEELNRVLTSCLADLHFAPTQKSRNNLIREGVSKDRIFLVGNTVIDSLNYIIKKINTPVDFGSDYVLVTAHRRENWGQPIENLCLAIKDVIAFRPESRFIFSVHKNPVVRDAVHEILGDNSNVELVEPLSYQKFILLLKHSSFVVSDSGGVQEEAPALGKPVLVFRKTTERLEGVEAGAVRIVGYKRESIKKWIIRLFEDKELYAKMFKTRNLYGDGTASIEIKKVLIDYFSKEATPTTANRYLAENGGSQAKSVI